MTVLASLRPLLGRGIRVFAAVVLAVVCVGAGLLATPPHAAAAQLRTNYPAITVEAGQTATFEVNVSSQRSERVQLSVGSKPPGWNVTLRGGGSPIAAVSVTPGSSPKVEAEIDVPDDAKPGTHRVVLNSSAASGSDRLVLELRVAKQAANAFELKCEFPNLQGTPSDTFTFNVDLHNNTADEATFNLTATGPGGWTVDASPQMKSKAAALHVDADSSVTIEVSADPPGNVPAGRYAVHLQAAGSGTTLSRKLTARVTGSAEMSLQTASERLNASSSAGDTSDIRLVVSNTGSAPLQNVDLSASPPTDWDVTFEPKSIPVVKPGKSVTVIAHATPAGDAITGDYDLTLSASSDAGTKNVDIRYSVQTSSWWGLVGIVVIAVVVVGLLWTFRRFGRR